MWGRGEMHLALIKLSFLNFLVIWFAFSRQFFACVFLRFLFYKSEN